MSEPRTEPPQADAARPEPAPTSEATPPATADAHVAARPAVEAAAVEAAEVGSPDVAEAPPASTAGHVMVLEIPPRNDYLAVARRFVAAAVSIGARLEPQRLNNLQVAVSEACTNAINAHVERGVDDAIAIRCDVSVERVEVVISDCGGGFDPDRPVELPAAEDPRRLDFEHGLGLRIMRALTDRLEIRSSARGTAVHVVMLAAAPAC